jgi:hypothetical protein
MLISSNAETDYAELITESPAAGFPGEAGADSAGDRTDPRPHA